MQLKSDCDTNRSVAAVQLGVEILLGGRSKDVIWIINNNLIKEMNYSDKVTERIVR